MRALVAVFAWVAAFAIVAGGALAAPLTDDLGRAVEPVGPRGRIAALSPFIAEAAFAVGAGEALVGVSEYSDYPAAARALPTLSNALGVSWERLAAARPDLVFAWKDSMREGDLERYRGLGIRVFVLSGRRLADVPRTLRAVAAMTGRAPPAAADEFERRIAALRARNAGKPPIAVLLEVQHRPLLTVAGEHFMNDALATCGATNAFASLPGVAPEVSWEALMARDPAAIVGAGAPSGEKDFRDRWSDHPTLSAVKRGALVYVDGDHFHRPTARLADGIESLCRQISGVRLHLS